MVTGFQGSRERLGEYPVTVADDNAHGPSSGPGRGHLPIIDLGVAAPVPGTSTSTGTRSSRKKRVPDHLARLDGGAQGSADDAADGEDIGAELSGWTCVPVQGMPQLRYSALIRFITRCWSLLITW